MIPASSTTIKVERNDTFDPDEVAAWTTVATGVRAHIDSTATPSTIAGQLVTGELWADDCDLKVGCRVTDERTSETSIALTARRHRAAQGLDHVRAALSRVEC